MPQPLSDPLLAAFGATIRDLRRAKGLSQEAFADLSNSHRTYIAEIETGKRNPTLINIARLAAALGIGVGEILVATEKRLSEGGRPGST